MGSSINSARFTPARVRLPLGGCASSLADEVRAPQWMGSVPGFARSRIIKAIFMVALAVGLGWSMNEIGREKFLSIFIAVISGALFLFGFFHLLAYAIGFCTGSFWKAKAAVVGACDWANAPDLKGHGSSEVPRIAIIMAIYHEDPEQIQRTVRIMWKSLHQSGLMEACDFFLLSDSTEPEIRQAEEKVYKELIEEFGLTPRQLEKPEAASPLGCLYLIRRAERKHYKVGNIAHFLEKHGGDYRYMLVLDADSIMLGGTIRRMLARMEADPQLGILQSTIIPHGSTSLFARSLEYSLARSLPLFAAGMSRLFGRSCVYWGHNALIRVKTFLGHAPMLIMPGKPPLGGPVLSHDIAEAALIGRAGYSIEWDLEATGSYDGLPPDVLSYGRRDRRWCQGNLQHFWLIFGDKIKGWHRFYFTLGILTYLSWPIFLFLNLLLSSQSGRTTSVSRGSFLEHGLVALFLSIVAVPKLLGLGRLCWLKRGQWRQGWKLGFRRAGSELASIFGEVIVSSLVTPILAYLHTRFVLEILSGQVAPWSAQRRQLSHPISWSEAASVLWPPTLLGLLWGTLVQFGGLSGWLVSWIFVGGWIFSIPLAVLTSDPRLGRFCSRMGLFPDCLTAAERWELEGKSETARGRWPAATPKKDSQLSGAAGSISPPQVLSQ